MAIKAVNNSTGLDRLVPTLLVFGAYLWITDNSLLSPSIMQWAEAIYKVIKEVWCLYATRQVNNVLGIRNSPNTLIMLDLPLQFEVYVWRKKRGWLGLYKLIVINS